jgi:hypothetical protein
LREAPKQAGTRMDIELGELFVCIKFRQPEKRPCGGALRASGAGLAFMPPILGFHTCN